MFYLFNFSISLVNGCVLYFETRKYIANILCGVPYA